MNSHYFSEYSNENLSYLASKVSVSLQAAVFSIDQYNDHIFKHEMIFFPEELKKAVNKRRAEYLAGRILAKKLLFQFGIRSKTIVSNHHRCPIWPKNIVGSISHCSSVAICVMAKSSEYSGLGVDIETVFSQTTISQIKGLVFDSNEWNRLRSSGIPIELASTIGFSAKESLFKALYPRVGYYFDFSAAIISQYDIENGELELELTFSLNSFLLKGMRFKVHFIIINNLIFSIVVW